MWPFKTKIVEVEKIVERVVVGEPTILDVYRAWSPGDSLSRYHVLYGFQPAKEFGYFLSCEEAFKASDVADFRVDKEKAIVVGGEYFRFYPGEAIKITKPKKAKGKS